MVLVNGLGLVDQHYWNIILDFVKEFALIAYETVTCIGQIDLSFAFWTGQYVQQLFAYSHFLLLIE